MSILAKATCKLVELTEAVSKANNLNYQETVRVLTNTLADVNEKQHQYLLSIGQQSAN